jgi:hypothetical protein
MQVCSACRTTPTPAGLEMVVQPLGDLLGEPLLHLWRAGEVLDQPGELGQPQDPVARQVAQAGDAGEWQHVVLTGSM